MKLLIIEDEPRAANRLQNLIRTINPKVEFVNVFESVRDAVRFLKTAPELDLIFADIQLADGLSFEIFKQIKVTCPIIFTTAYDQYAIEAFNTNGIDYLLKPIEAERLRQAFDKLDNLIPNQNLDTILDVLSAKAMSAKKYKSRFMLRVGEQIKTIATTNIKVFYSFDRATFILTKNNSNYIIEHTLDQLESLLDPNQFFRVNRKYFVSLEACKQIYAWSNSRLKIEVEGVDDEIVVARDRVNNFKEWLDA